MTGDYEQFIAQEICDSIDFKMPTAEGMAAMRAAMTELILLITPALKDGQLGDEDVFGLIMETTDRVGAAHPEAKSAQTELACVVALAATGMVDLEDLIVRPGTRSN